MIGGGYRGRRDIVEPGGGVIVFFRSDCPASEILVPRLNALARALELEDRLFIGIAEEGEVSARAFHSDHALGFPVAYDAAPHATTRDYGITTLPTLLVVDGMGIVAERLQGFIKADYLSLGPAIEQALALGNTPPMLDRPEDLPDIKPG